MAKAFHNIERVNESRTFINLGFTDYLAARVLLNTGLVLQGISMASTSIEKYFKAILSLNETVHRRHLNRDLLKAVRTIDPNLFQVLNESFFLLLEKCYKLRYLDDLPNGFSVALIQYPSLAELDYSVEKIESRFTLFEESRKLELRYQQMRHEKDPQLVENNFLYSGLGKNQFIESMESKVYCMRIMPPPSRYLEMTYTASKQPHDGNFLRELHVFHKPTIDNPNMGMELPFPNKKFKQ
jgi:hypothetical protein